MLRFADADKSLISHVFISDLHLATDCGTNSPAIDVADAALWQAFLSLLDELSTLPHLQQLYILGDWFEAWIGDDAALCEPIVSCLAPMLEKLRALHRRNVAILVMHGNRDFTIGQKFCNRFGGQLIKEPYNLDLNGKKIRLEHGDALTTDDKAYQRFRRIIRHPITKGLLLALPLSKRTQLANNLRQQSQAGNAKKSMQIMDVSADTVEAVMHDSKHPIDILLHGHTHRPCLHELSHHKQRIVLGDWRFDGKNVEAVISVSLEQQPLALYTFNNTYKP